MRAQEHTHSSRNERHNPPQNNNKGVNSSQGDILFGVSFSDSSSELKFDDSPVSRRPNQEPHQIDQEDPGSPCPDDSSDTSPCRSVVSDEDIDIPPLNIRKQSTSRNSSLASSSPKLRRTSSHRIGSGSSRSSIPRADSPTLPLGSSRFSIPRADSPTLPPETGDSEDSDSDPDIKLIKASSEAARFTRGKATTDSDFRSLRERVRDSNSGHLPSIASDSDVTDIDSCGETQI